jgi:predicted nucleic acid-binding protein
VIVYFDTSAFVPLLVTEPGTASASDLWDLADEVVTTRLLYVEAAAALARARRMGRITDRSHHAALQSLDDLWRDFRVTELDETVIRRAAELADRHALRGYDAVHCASAERIADADLVVASGDKDLLAACTELGLATALTAQ